MEKQVLITVDSKMDDLSGENNALSLVTEGKLLVENDEYVLSYEESQITGLNGTTTVIRASNDSVTLIRHGSVSSMMLFEVGKTHLTDYQTQYGSIMLGITAQKVDVSMDESGGQINVDYIVEYNRAYGGKNSISVKIQEITGNRSLS
ncbi:MAG: DUF1934 domain-containing protein [Clostridiaceae bacterium]|nr:DUF1934 domain-containing protein [Bacillota bacterium]NLI39163.1 DUF1934 domain-containing protein [Clostridiaceae bacterium]